MLTKAEIALKINVVCPLFSEWDGLSVKSCI